MCGFLIIIEWSMAAFRGCSYVLEFGVSFSFKIGARQKKTRSSTVSHHTDSIKAMSTQLFRGLPYCLTSGTGLILSVAWVMTPKLPSDPRTIWLMSGPMETRGAYSTTS
jgi:hypothetical protein